MPRGQDVRNDLNAPRVTDGEVEVHVNDRDVACNLRAPLPTDTGDGMLEQKVLAILRKRTLHTLSGGHHADRGSLGNGTRAASGGAAGAGAVEGA